MRWLGLVLRILEKFFKSLFARKKRVERLKILIATEIFKVFILKIIFELKLESFKFARKSSFEVSLLKLRNDPDI